MAAYERYDNAAGEKRWHYRKRVTLPDGRKIRITGTPAINTKKAAEDAERAHVERVLNPPKKVRERRLMSAVFDLFLDEYVATANNKESEKAAKKSAIDCHLGPELGKLYVDEVSAAKIDELSARLHKRKKARGEGTLGPKTIKNILQTLRKCLNWAKKRDWIEEVPEIEMPRVDQEEIRFLEEAELSALLDASSSEPMWFAAVVVAADAGLRQGELRALRWTDINEVTGQIVVSRSRWRNVETTTKSRKPRSVPLTERATSALKAIRSTRLRGPYVFSRRDGKPFGPEHMNDTIDRLTRKAKLTDAAWHTLRHTFCTNLAMEGANASTIQQLAGHESIATTQRYMHVQKGAAAAAIALLDRRASRARAGHEPEQDADLNAEAGELIQLDLVTPKGLES